MEIYLSRLDSRVVSNGAGEAPAPRDSDAGVPGVSALGSCRTQTFTKRFKRVRQGYAGDVFDALVSELAREAKAHWSAKGDGKIGTVHASSDQRLRMQRIGHVDALPPIGLNRAVNDVTNLRQCSDAIKNVGKRHSTPFSDIRPALFATNHRDVRTFRETSDLRQRECCRTGSHAIDGQTPIHKASGLQSLEFVAERRDFVREWIFRNLAARKLASHRMVVQQSLRGIGQCFAGAVESAGVGRNQTMTLRQFCRKSHT